MFPLASAVGANAETNISARAISQEPMVSVASHDRLALCLAQLCTPKYLLANLAISPSFGGEVLFTRSCSSMNLS